MISFQLFNRFAQMIWSFKYFLKTERHKLRTDCGYVVKMTTNGV